MNLIVNHRMRKERNVVLQIYGRQETNTAVQKIMIIFSSTRRKIIRFSIFLRPPCRLCDSRAEPVSSLQVHDIALDTGRSYCRKQVASLNTSKKFYIKWFNDLFVLYQHVSDTKLLLVSCRLSDVLQARKPLSAR